MGTQIQIASSGTNPTSGVIPFNDGGVFADSPISKISQGINIDGRTYTKGLYVQDYSSQFDSISMRYGTILNFDSFTGDFIFGDFSFPFVKGNYFNSILALSSNGSTPHLNIDSSGNVGIGTTAPSEKLDVNGTVKAQGYKSSDGSVGVTGTANASNTLTIKNGLIVGIS